MDAGTRDALTSWFRDYVDGFRLEGGKHHPMVELKLGHSARVAMVARTIAEDAAWTGDEVNLAQIAGLLHDVGRFSQWAEFGTYRDSVSTNHAARGHTVLERSDVLAIVRTEERDRLVTSLLMHNLRDLPADVPEPSRALCELVRDADKLDLWEIIFGHVVDGTLQDLLPERDAEPVANPELLREIAETKRATYLHVRTLADYLLTSIAWVYDLNFPTSARIARERNVVGRLAQHLPDTADVRKTVEDAKDHLARWTSR